jgi:hypothetical protein
MVPQPKTAIDTGALHHGVWWMSPRPITDGPTAEDERAATEPATHGSARPWV